MRPRGCRAEARLSSPTCEGALTRPAALSPPTVGYCLISSASTQTQVPAALLFFLPVT